MWPGTSLILTSTHLNTSSRLANYKAMYCVKAISLSLFALIQYKSRLASGIRIVAQH